MSYFALNIFVRKFKKNIEGVPRGAPIEVDLSKI